MDCILVFEDWRRIGKPDSIYSTELGIELSSGDLHSGSCFSVKVEFDYLKYHREIREAMKNHNAYPVFRLIVEEK